MSDGSTEKLRKFTEKQGGDRRRMIGVQISDQQSFVLVMSQKSGVGSAFLPVVAQGNPQRGTDLPLNLVESVTS